MDAGEEQRYKVRFPDRESLVASQAAESALIDVVVFNASRRFISVSAAGEARLGGEQVDKQLELYVTEYGAEIVVDRQYSPEDASGDAPRPAHAEAPSRATSDASTLDDVLELIRAPKAWELSRGAGAVLAIVDTGIEGSRPEFPPVKRRGQWSPIGRDAWVDAVGHGTMCACIAAATRAGGGEFDGVAPDAGIIACRTTFRDSELTTIYDFLGDYAEEHGVPVVASNSWGIKSGDPPSVDSADDFPKALDDALSRGVIAVFSAGNYHRLAGGAAGTCEPTSIWTHKCRADVLTVGGSLPDGSIWPSSSRGPGQYFGDPAMSQKPDVVAPTPIEGRVLYGAEARTLSDWGTSAACPQVAGLIGLALAQGVTSREGIFGAIRGAARTLGHDPACEGNGIIDCQGTLTRLAAPIR